MSRNGLGELRPPSPLKLQSRRQNTELCRRDRIRATLVAAFPTVAQIGPGLERRP